MFPAFCLLLAVLVVASVELVPDHRATLLRLAAIAVSSWSCALLAERLPRLRPWLCTVGAGLVLFALYESLGWVTSWVHPEDQEWRLLALDRSWFAYSWEGWWGGVAHPLLTDFLQLVYATFYFFPFLFAFSLARRGDEWGLYNGIDRILLGFLLSYCGYLLVPARSPYDFVVYAAELPSAGLQPWLHQQLLHATSTRRDCFPSGHTMMSAYVAWLSWQRARQVFWLLGPWAAATVVATLYLRYHYLIDVIAGLAAAALWALAADFVFGSYRRGPLESRP